jgi:predicted NAD/FAD-binding protein
MNPKKEKLAIIGTGIAGLGAAHHLQNKYDIVLFEKNNYVGGHTNTVYVEENDRSVPVDTGFMVFNKHTYPNLLQLFQQLSVPIKETSMSFSVQHISSGLEYCGSGFNGLFAQRKNLISPSFYKMLWQINRFNKERVTDLHFGNLDKLSLAEYIRLKEYGKDFMNKYLLPMSSAIWSTPPDISMNFPAKTLVRFFLNHGMLGMDTHFQWYTVDGGSESYKELLIAPLKEKIRVNTGIESVTEKQSKVEITTQSGEKYLFDKVVIASHADQALKMLNRPSQLQRDLLSKFQYQKNKAVLHSDTTVMPKNKRVWSSWNHILDDRSGKTETSTVYDMNSLQNVSDKQNYFVSINPIEVDDSKIHCSIDYDHPIFTVDAMNAQARLQELNQEGPIYFCGSYFRYGFHEDAYTSGLELAQQLLSETEMIENRRKAG